jgi:hypothetical protein
MWDAAGATSSKQRKALGTLLTALTHGIDSAILYEPGTTHRCVWRILSADVHTSVKEKAILSTASELITGARKRSKDCIDKEVLRALAEAGKTRCDVCSMPLLDPDDPEFDRKANEFEQLARSDHRCGDGCDCST